MKKIEKVNVLGVRIARLTFEEIPDIIISLIKRPGKKTFFYTSAHCLNLAQGDPEYKKILNEATIVYSGGFGPVLASKVLHKNKPLIERMTTPNFIDKVFSVSQDESWKIYFLGGEQKLVKKSLRNVKKKFPKIKIVGCHDGYFNEREEKVLKTELNRKKPKILLIGMGSPKQEKWIRDNKDELDVEVFWSAGAIFDMISGAIPRAPRFMQESGFEWLWRLIQEPRRLWKRYIIGNLVFIFYTFRQKIGI